jgi:hypothetical protein
MPVTSYNDRMLLKHCILLLLAVLACSGCNRANFDPAYASRPYPFQLHTTDALAVQVFRDGKYLEIVNSTDKSWGASTIWVNQQYAYELPGLVAGQRVTFNLVDSRNDLGESFNAGGPFRTREPTPVRLVEIQPGEGQPLVGFIAIRGGVVE